MPRTVVACAVVVVAAACGQAEADALRAEIATLQAEKAALQARGAGAHASRSPPIELALEQAVEGEGVTMKVAPSSVVAKHRRSDVPVAGVVVARNGREVLVVGDVACVEGGAAGGGPAFTTTLRARVVEPTSEAIVASVLTSATASGGTANEACRAALAQARGPLDEALARATASPPP